MPSPPKAIHDNVTAEYHSKSNYFKPNMSILSSLDPGLNLLGSSWYLVPFVLIVRESQFGFGPRWILRRWQGHVLATPLKIINSNCFRKWLQLWKTVQWRRYRIWVMYSSSCAHRFEHVVLFGQEGIWKGFDKTYITRMQKLPSDVWDWLNTAVLSKSCTVHYSMLKCCGNLLSFSRNPCPTKQAPPKKQSLVL